MEILKNIHRKIMEGVRLIGRGVKKQNNQRKQETLKHVKKNMPEDFEERRRTFREHTTVSAEEAAAGLREAGGISSGDYLIGRVGGEEI